jgi:hypothetical protein
VVVSVSGILHGRRAKIQVRCSSSAVAVAGRDGGGLDRIVLMH